MNLAPTARETRQIQPEGYIVKKFGPFVAKVTGLFYSMVKSLSVVYFIFSEYLYYLKKLRINRNFNLAIPITSDKVITAV